MTKAGITTAAALGAASLGAALQAEAADGRPADEPFGYCLNTSTIREQNVGIVKAAEIAAEAGYQGIEPWIREIDDYVQGGGSLKDLAKRIADLGLKVESAIGFARWIVDDDAERAQGLEEARRTMDLVAQLGGTAHCRAAGRRHRQAAARSVSGRRALSQAARTGRHGWALRRSWKFGAFPRTSAVWARRRWWRSRAAIRKPACCWTSTISTRAVPDSAA